VRLPLGDKNAAQRLILLRCRSKDSCFPLLHWTPRRRKSFFPAPEDALKVRMFTVTTDQAIRRFASKASVLKARNNEA